jgi:hypothetical protein
MTSELEICFEVWVVFAIQIVGTSSGPVYGRSTQITHTVINSCAWCLPQLEEFINYHWSIINGHFNDK